MTVFNGSNGLAIVLVILFLAAFSPVRAQWDDIVIDTITNTHIRKQTTLQSLDLDPYGFAHLVWRQAIDGGGNRIFYSTNSDLEYWQPPQEITDSTRQSFSPALVYSASHRRPYVVLMQDSEIILAYEQEEIWHNEQITSNSQLDEFPTIAVDTSGNIHLAWITEDTTTNEYKIAYAIGSFGNWDIQILIYSDLGDYGTGASPFIDVSNEGAAHITYRGGNYGNYHIHHAWNDSAGSINWQYEIISSGNINDFSSCVAVDDDGNTHAAFSGNDGWGFPSRTFYNYKPEGGYWLGPELVSLDYSAVRPSLYIDVYGTPHVICMEVSGNIYTGDILYSYRDENDCWNISELIGGDHFTPSFKIDQSGGGHIGYHTGGNSADYDIYYLTGDAATSIDGTDSERNMARLYILSQNFPNPFNNQTAINYHIPQADFVTVEIYNVLGERISVLVNEFKQAGNYQVQWNASDISTGIYFYKLNAGKYLLIRKCLLLK